MAIRYADTSLLHIAYEAHGPEDGDPVILLHGFPYDPRCFDAVAPPLGAQDYRVVVPYLRGYGPTEFRDPATLRSGQQAALAVDLRDLMDALGIARAALMGFDWGGRAACIAAALWPERVRCLVTGDGYNIQHIASFATPALPETEHRLWYQYYFHTQRGRDGLAVHREAFGQLLWQLWSPSWSFDAATYARTAASFANPDFVDVVIHSYRHRYGYAAGDPRFAAIETALARRPPITVPAISLCGADDGVAPPAETDHDRGQFTGAYRRDILAGTGHDIPQEAPGAVLAALRTLLAD